MRKRLIFETLHLDVEGGVGERRTTPATTVIATDEAAHAGHVHDHVGLTTSMAGAATIQVQVEEVQTKLKSVSIAENVVEAKESNVTGPSVKKPKQRKKVAFHSERPDLYDF